MVARLGLDEAAGGAIARAIAAGDFAGDRDQATLLYGVRGPRRVLLLGLGEHAQITRAALRTAAAVGMRRALGLGAKSVALHVTQETHPGVPAEALGQVATEGALQGAWKFVQLKAVRDGKGPVESFDLIVSREIRADVDRGRARGHAVGVGQRLARNLQMLPGNVCTPEYLATVARDLGRAYG